MQFIAKQKASLSPSRPAKDTLRHEMWKRSFLSSDLPGLDQRCDLYLKEYGSGFLLWELLNAASCVSLRRSDSEIIRGHFFCLFLPSCRSAETSVNGGFYFGEPFWSLSAHECLLSMMQHISGRSLHCVKVKSKGLLDFSSTALPLDVIPS